MGHTLITQRLEAQSCWGYKNAGSAKSPSYSKNVGCTSKKNPKAKPAKLTEFFSTSSDPRKKLTYPSSSTPCSRPDLVDYDHQEAFGLGTSTEHTLQKLFHSFREDLQVDFLHMMSEFGHTSSGHQNKAH